MTPLQFDIPAVIRQKAPKAHVPAFIIRYLERITHVKQMNSFLRKYPSLHGYEFIERAISEELGCSASIDGTEHIPTDGKPVIFVSNHPLGGLDGMIIAQMIHETRQSSNRQSSNRPLKVIVNDLLMYLPGLAPLCIPINKTGKASRNFPAMVETGFQSDNHMLMFPAGLCSRRHNGVIRDIAWKKTFISKSVEYQRDVIPIHFSGQNSSFFYRLANFSDRFLPFNLAMLFLVDEMYKNVGKTFRIAIGKPIPWQTFDKSKSPMEWAQYVQDIVYNL